MSSGRQKQKTSRAIGGTTSRIVLAVVLATIAGCAPLQRNWDSRFGDDRLVPIPSPAPPIAGDAAPAPTDSYAARVGLDDRPRLTPGPEPAWVDTPDVRPAAPEADAIAQPVRPSTPSTLISRPADTERSTDRIEPTAPPEPVAPPPNDLDTIASLVDRGIAHLNGLRNYQVTVDRQERVRDSLLPAERVLQSVRTEPFAVRLEWPEGANQGREVLYSEAECEGMMHVKLGKTLIPVPPMQLEPHSMIALSNSRHPITEAGLLHILNQTREQLDRERAGDPAIGHFSITGPLVPSGLERSGFEIVRTTPEGEFWRLVIEEETGIPVLLEATTADGQLLERYHFQDIRTDLDDLDQPGAFDPAVRFGRPLT